MQKYGIYRLCINELYAFGSPNQRPKKVGQSRLRIMTMSWYKYLTGRGVWLVILPIKHKYKTRKSSFLNSSWSLIGRLGGHILLCSSVLPIKLNIMSQNPEVKEPRFSVFSSKCFPSDLYVVENRRTTAFGSSSVPISGKQSQVTFLLRATVRCTHASRFRDFVTQGRAATPDWSSWHTSEWQPRVHKAVPDTPRSTFGRLHSW